MEKPELRLFLSFVLSLLKYIHLKLWQLLRSLSFYKRWTVRKLIWRRGLLFRPAAHFGVAALALLAIIGGAVFGPLPSLANQPQLATPEVVATPTVTQTEIPSDRPRPASVEHVVVVGETISNLAAQYNVSVDSIKWASNLTSDVINPGDKVLIPPVSGIVYTVAKGDTLASIAKTHGVTTEVIKNWAFNDVPEEGTIEQGQILVLPGGRPPEVVNPPAPKAKPAPKPMLASHPAPAGGWANRYPFGQCTWWVAQKRYVPWMGNAIQWYAAAVAFGYRVGKTPVPGAIMVTTGNSRLGHVAYVEGVTSGGVVISEMNSTAAPGGGWGKVDTRTVIPGRTDIVIGYIY